jgi:hypothetical protein
MRRQWLAGEGARGVDAAVRPAELAKLSDFVDQHLDLFFLAWPGMPALCIITATKIAP